jgi:hypothetical protein
LEATITALTKVDVKALHAADTLVVHLSKNSPNGRVTVIKERHENGDVWKAADGCVTRLEREIPAAVRIHNHFGGSPYAVVAEGTVSCFGHVNVYRSQHTQAAAILKSLRAGDELTFEFCPDWHNNGWIANAGLHADVLELSVRRNGQLVVRWELEQNISPNNTARMCRGFPDPDGYADSTRRARENA